MIGIEQPSIVDAGDFAIAASRQKQGNELEQPLKIQVTACGTSHAGRVRHSNEDAYFCDVQAGVFVVCDGMGGAAAGEVASNLAAKSAGDALAESGATEAFMFNAVAVANEAVFERASCDRRLEGMGTTLVALALDGDGGWMGHVGDSRCYVWRDERLERLTVDHSLVEEQIRLGQMTRSEAERSPFQHVITRAVGTAPTATPDVDRVPVLAGDVFLLASDGLTRELSDDRIADVLRSVTDIEDAVRHLVESANRAGGRDNITCVLVKIG